MSYAGMYCFFFIAVHRAEHAASGARVALVLKKKIVKACIFFAVKSCGKSCGSGMACKWLLHSGVTNNPWHAYR